MALLPSPFAFGMILMWDFWGMASGIGMMVGFAASMASEDLRGRPTARQLPGRTYIHEAF